MTLVLFGVGEPGDNTFQLALQDQRSLLLGHWSARSPSAAKEVNSFRAPVTYVERNSPPQMTDDPKIYCSKQCEQDLPLCFLWFLSVKETHSPQADVGKMEIYAFKDWRCLAHLSERPAVAPSRGLAVCDGSTSLRPDPLRGTSMQNMEFI